MAWLECEACLNTPAVFPLFRSPTAKECWGHTPLDEGGPVCIEQIEPADLVQWSEDVIKADPFFGRSRVRFRVPPWVSNTIARDPLA